MAQKSFGPATKEYKVLKKNADKLQRAITDPKSLSMGLLSKDLISTEILQKVKAAVNSSDANMELITNLLDAVVIDPNNFQKLLQVLEDYPPLLTAVAGEMKEEYELPDSKYLSSNEQPKTITVDDFENLKKKMEEIHIDVRKLYDDKKVGAVTEIDDAGDDTDQGTGSDSATPLYIPTWRHYPVTPREVMIIGSFGDQIDRLKQQYIVSPKILKTELSDEWRKEEIKKIAGLYSGNPDQYHIKSIYYDLPGSEHTKEYYMKAIKQFFINCKQPGAILYYTGHGEKDTGNWCFKDGVISFNDIFELYINHFKGKSLSITSDCSYSGNWINECGKRLDEMNVPSCGHHTREQGLLFKIFTSCQPNEEATALCYINEAVRYSEADKGVVFWYGKTLTSGQKTKHTDFKYIRCGKPAIESCEADADCTWNDHLSNKYHLLYLVRGKDRQWDAWHYVLVDEEKLVDFDAKIAAGTIDVADYGRVLKSGWGKDPPKNIARKIDLRCGYLLKPIEA